MTARDRMQHYDAYIDPVTHQVPADDLPRQLQRHPGREERHLQDPGAEQAQGRRRCRRGRDLQARVLRSDTQLRTLREPERAMIANLLPHLVNGISLGLLFALIALGFMLIVGVMETINLAHGSLFALGMYAALFVVAPAAGLVPGGAGGLHGVAARHALRHRALVAPVLVGLFGLLLELCLRRTYGKDPLYGLLLTFGAALVIEEGIRVVWGTNDSSCRCRRRSRARFIGRRPDLLEATASSPAPSPSSPSRRCGSFSRRRPTARSSRPARTTARWCARWASTSAACALRCSRSVSRWPRWRAW